MANVLYLPRKYSSGINGAHFYCSMERAEIIPVYTQLVLNCVS
jgi:hypothetical protein